MPFPTVSQPSGEDIPAWVGPISAIEMSAQAQMRLITTKPPFYLDNIGLAGALDKTRCLPEAILSNCNEPL
jgi:hypothetical protein